MALRARYQLVFGTRKPPGVMGSNGILNVRQAGDGQRALGRAVIAMGQEITFELARLEVLPGQLPGAFDGLRHRW